MAFTLTKEIIQTLTDEQRAVVLFSPLCTYCFEAEEPFNKCISHFKCTLTGEVTCPKLLNDACPTYKVDIKKTYKVVYGFRTAASTSPAKSEAKKTVNVRVVPNRSPSPIRRRNFKKAKSLRTGLLNRLFLKRLWGEYYKQQELGHTKPTPQLPDPRVLRDKRLNYINRATSSMNQRSG